MAWRGAKVSPMMAATHAMAVPKSNEPEVPPVQEVPLPLQEAKQVTVPLQEVNEVLVEDCALKEDPWVKGVKVPLTSQIMDESNALVQVAMGRIMAELKRSGATIVTHSIQDVPSLVDVALEPS
ncbi:hypothetical protein GOP47_0031226 [Adiantum capillus-veneris]|nr:hypothetical protein GOP47_0031226 [Adiantum capillus-veneris]